MRHVSDIFIGMCLRSLLGWYVISTWHMCLSSLLGKCVRSHRVCVKGCHGYVSKIFIK